MTDKSMSLKVDQYKLCNLGEFISGPVVKTWAFTARAWVQSLIREQRSHKPSGTAKKKKIMKSKQQIKKEKTKTTKNWPEPQGLSNNVKRSNICVNRFSEGEAKNTEQKNY